MIKIFSNLKIAHKLAAISMLSTILALMIGSVVMMSYNNQSNYNSIQDNLTQITHLLSRQLQHNDELQDRETATKKLTALEINPTVILGCLYRIENDIYKLFSSWSRNKTSSSVCPKYNNLKLSMKESFRAVKYSPISADQRIIGAIYIESNQKQQFIASDSLLLFTLGLVLLIALLAYFISSRLQKIILKPLENLTHICATVLQNKDYSVRSSDSSSDEFGTLAVSFNNILSTIDQQNIDLHESKNKFNSLIVALQESEERFRAIFEQAGDSIVLVNIYDGKFYEHNRIAHQTLGYSSDELSKLQLADIEFVQNPDQSGSHSISETDIPESFESQLINKEGDILDVLISAKDVIIRNKPFRILIISNITEKKRIEREIISLNSRIQAVLDSATQISIIAVDLKGSITVFNRGAELLLGYQSSDMISRNLLKSIHVESELTQHQQEIKQEFNIRSSKFEALTEKVRRSGFETDVWHYRSKDGEEIPVQLTVTEIKGHDKNLQGYLSIAFDLRAQYDEERRHNALEDQLHQSQKMQTIGTLAGGIAHDLNNLLTPILGYTEMVLGSIENTSREHSRLSHVMNAAIRARDLVKQILTFSHQLEHDVKPIQIQTIVNEVVELLTASLPPSIHLLVEQTDPDIHILANATKIHQILMNLCTNSAHAMTEKGGDLSILVSQLFINPEQRPELQLAEGDYACISVADTGCGMSEDTLSRIFEPFFTTKDIGEGTGLGLSVAHGIVTAHNGNIQVESEQGKGTRFKIYLPLVEAEDQLQLDDNDNISDKNISIMFVDDESLITDMISNVLMDRGFQVVSLDSSSKALEMMKDSSKHFDLLISDQVMPELTGLELALQVHNIRPELPIILLTGLGNQIDNDDLDDYGIVNVLSKPVLSKDLIKAIHNSINQFNCIKPEKNS